MSIESVAGKNPVTHVGNLYNLAATRIANRLVRDGAAITGASSVLVSQIGHPVEDPQFVDLRLELKPGFSIGNMRTRV